MLLAGKQAKTLSPAQIKTALSYLDQTRNAERDVVMFLMSVRAGLRAKEIAGATWIMVLGSDGLVSDTLHLEDRVAKMKSGRTIPIAKQSTPSTCRMSATSSWQISLRRIPS